MTERNVLKEGKFHTKEHLTTFKLLFSEKNKK